MKPPTLDDIHAIWLAMSASDRQTWSEHLYEVVIGGAEYHGSEDKPYLENATAQQRWDALKRAGLSV